MRIPPRAKKAIEIVEEVEDMLKYYLGEFPPKLRQDVKYLKEYLAEISQEKKLNDIKVAVKIKKELEDAGDN